MISAKVEKNGHDGYGKKAELQKKVTAGIWRDTCAVQQLKRGEGIERVLQRLGLSETTWEDARVKYEKLAKAGIYYMER